MYLTPYAENVRPHLESGDLGLLITPQSHRPEQYDVGAEDLETRAPELLLELEAA